MKGDAISSIEDVDIKMKAIMAYHKMHEEYTLKVFSDDFGISTDDRRFNIEDALDERFGQNIAKIARTINDDDIKLRLIDNYVLQITDEDKRSILGTIKSDVKRMEAEVRFNINITPEELANDEEARKSYDEFTKQAERDNSKDENEH